jgi:hypothetical protein
MERYLYDRRAGDYRERLGAAPGTHAWPFSQALAANIAIAGLPHLGVQAPVRARFATLERRFRSATAYAASPHGDLYLDDNEWLAEDFLDWSDLTGDRSAQARAAAIFNAVIDAWDDVATHPCSGGVFWTTSSVNRDRNEPSGATTRAASSARTFFSTRSRAIRRRLPAPSKSPTQRSATSATGGRAVSRPSLPRSSSAACSRLLRRTDGRTM